MSIGCKKCGECCKWTYISFDDEYELGPLEFLRGIEYVTKEKDIIRIPCKCRNLDSETNLCTDYENRPVDCRIFPQHTVCLYIPKECKYYEDDGK